MRDILKAHFEIEDKYCCPDCGGNIITKAYEDNSPDQPSWLVIPGIKEDSYIKFEWRCRELDNSTLWLRTRPSTNGEWLRELSVHVEIALRSSKDSEDNNE